MGKSRFIELMAKSIGDSATKVELHELEVFLDQFPEYKKMQNVANALKLEAKAAADVYQGKNLDAGLAQLWNIIDEFEHANIRSSANKEP